ncbi:hypothetical protein BOSE62_71538 [Bosea sp. 62]|nr:hypothetical protein BOSE46_80187 [Bosea sp. 46]VVT62192.1 hypothetical protein BOS5A_30053 [Bosea sp. EC-HK365B]VXC72634.1 hypothetical protein BOSE29B_80075 [Bosea sp. 29B]VXC93326.1 hypothetical protein BOSE62_71538 [Bosea sp. 62]
MNTCDVQAALLSFGHPLAQFGADGDFGGGTRAAVQAFKRKCGLPVTDKPDAATTVAFRAALVSTKPFPTPLPAGRRSDPRSESVMRCCFPRCRPLVPRISSNPVAEKRPSSAPSCWVNRSCRPVRLFSPLTPPPPAPGRFPKTILSAPAARSPGADRRIWRWGASPSPASLTARPSRTRR